MTPAFQIDAFESDAFQEGNPNPSVPFVAECQTVIITVKYTPIL